MALMTIYFIQFFLTLVNCLCHSYESTQGESVRGSKNSTSLGIQSLEPMHSLYPGVLPFKTEAPFVARTVDFLDRSLIGDLK